MPNLGKLPPVDKKLADPVHADDMGELAYIGLASFDAIRTGTAITPAMDSLLDRKMLLRYAD